MDIRIGTDCVSDWKRALTQSRDARFIWIWNREGRFSSETDPVEQVQIDADLPVRTATCPFAWLAEPNDVIVTNQGPSPGFLDYVRSIRSFSPMMVTLPGCDQVPDWTESLLRDEGALARIADLRQENTFIFPFHMLENIEKISSATGIDIAGLSSHQAYRTWNSKCEGRTLCRDQGIRLPPGSECHTVGALRTTIDQWPAPAFPILIKDADAAGGAGHTVLTCREDGERFLEPFQAMSESAAVRYVVEALIAHGPDDNISFRLVVGKGGDIALTDMHREWIYAPTFKAVAGETPHHLGVMQEQAIVEAAEKIGCALYRGGFHGIAGIDGIIDSQGHAFPVLDINPRITGDIFTTNIVAQYMPSTARTMYHTVRCYAAAPTFAHARLALKHLPHPSHPEGGIVLLRVRAYPEYGVLSSDGATLGITVTVFAPNAERSATLSQDVADTLRNYFEGQSDSRHGPCSEGVAQH